MSRRNFEIQFEGIIGLEEEVEEEEVEVVLNIIRRCYIATNKTNVAYV